ncbi:MAG: hypothetical protein NUV86_11455 [Candidatus Scalindua sp.]|nr:hypothetical protein [Candidatus Scalindua sp.]MCR4344309.1 hypothetical protein [Candidatus Scalindua sp.]
MKSRRTELKTYDVRLLDALDDGELKEKIDTEVVFTDELNLQ